MLKSNYLEEFKSSLRQSNQLNCNGIEHSNCEYSQLVYLTLQNLIYLSSTSIHTSSMNFKLKKKGSLRSDISLGDGSVSVEHMMNHCRMGQGEI